MNLLKCYTAREFAELCGVTRQTINNNIRKGKIGAKTFGNMNLICPEYSEYSSSLIPKVENASQFGRLLRHNFLTVTEAGNFLGISRQAVLGLIKRRRLRCNCFPDMRPKRYLIWLGDLKRYKKEKKRGIIYNHPESPYFTTREENPVPIERSLKLYD